MKNLSSSGCMVECHHILAPIDAEIEIALLPGHVASGKVAWQVGESIGIAFDKRIRFAVVRYFALDDWILRKVGSADLRTPSFAKT